MDDGNIPQNKQTLATNPTNPLPQLDNRPPENTDDNCVRKKQQMMIPMTRQQFELEQSQIRSVYDPESGRVRLIRGSGEIIESMVRRSQHIAINQIATRSDGQSYTRNVFSNNAASQKR